MKGYFVLFVFFVNAAAQAPNTCPKPPINLLCWINLKNSCVDNSTCPTGTLCCQDGCRYRCRDPSNNNRGAGTGIKPGTCPSQLSPPPGPCASDSDECMLDADCDGTKKCCFNNCFRECVEPGISAIRDGCPAPKQSPRCHMSFGNKCFNHSECSFLKDGHCCYDGCRRRCASPDGFPSRIEAPRPGQCPVIPAPEFCVSDADECEFDGDCFPGKKCCSNTCFTRCVDPVGLPGSNASEVGSLRTEGEASGKCPFTSVTKRCPLLGHMCNLDKDCPAGYYCCFDSCRRKCLDPNDDSGGASGQDKSGTCPTLVPPEFCVADVDECFFDGDCFGDRKCCSNGCYSVCVPPSLGAAASVAVKSCPEPVAYRCGRSEKHQCDDSKDCLTGTYCCHDGCRRRCVSSTSADTCPEPPQNLICPIGLRNTCVDDASCRPGTVCCSDGCRKRCVDPSSLSDPDSGSGHQGKPRPGTCPSLTPPSEFCPSDFDECLYDWDCEPTTKKCCSNGCYKVCAEPVGGEVQDKCPTPKKPERGCPLTFRNQCSNHTDCNYVSGGLCCYDGCRRRCATPDGFPNPRPGKCPLLLPPEFCIAHFDECENDGDCYPVKKCCSNGCFNRCVNPTFGEIDSIALDPTKKCPFVTPSERCHVGIRNECNDHAECENGTYCCFTGCRSQCWDPADRSSAKLNKTGTCPVLPPPPQPCPSDVHECYMDNDCLKDMKCCSNGCYRVCVSPSKESAATLAKCPPLKSFHCTASLKYECTTDCPDGKICCFDSCSRRCIDHKSSSITRLYKIIYLSFVTTLCLKRLLSVCLYMKVGSPAFGLFFLKKR